MNPSDAPQPNASQPPAIDQPPPAHFISQYFALHPQGYSYATVQALRLKIQRNRERNYKKLDRLTAKSNEIMKEDVLKPLQKNRERYSKEFQQQVEELKQVF